MTISDIAAQAALVSRRACRDDNGYRIEMTRDYDYPVEDVWSAWTTPERLKRWLGEPRGQLRIGGRVELAMDADSVIHLVIHECEKPTALLATWQAHDEVESEVRLRLEALATNRTRLTLTHSRLDHGQALDVGPGWEEFLYVLDIFLGVGSIDEVPWDRHEAVVTLTDDWRRTIAAPTG